MVFTKGHKINLGKKYSKERCKNISISLQDHIVSTKTRQKQSKSRKMYLKNDNVWNKGLTKETDERVKKSSETLKYKFRVENMKSGMSGKKHKDKTKKKMSRIHKKMHKQGKWETTAYWKNKNIPEKVKRKMSISRTGKCTGKDNASWLGGKSFEPYGIEFNNQLKESIRKRDNYRCQECFKHQDELRTKSNRKYKLNIYHIDYDKKNNHSENLISLCRSCHTQTNFKREDWINYFEKEKGLLK